MAYCAVCHQALISPDAACYFCDSEAIAPSLDRVESPPRTAVPSSPDVIAPSRRVNFVRPYHFGHYRKIEDDGRTLNMGFKNTPEMLISYGVSRGSALLLALMVSWSFPDLLAPLAAFALGFLALDTLLFLFDIAGHETLIIEGRDYVLRRGKKTYKQGSVLDFKCLVLRTTYNKGRPNVRLSLKFNDGHDLHITTFRSWFGVEDNIPEATQLAQQLQRRLEVELDVQKERQSFMYRKIGG